MKHGGPFSSGRLERRKSASPNCGASLLARKQSEVERITVTVLPGPEEPDSEATLIRAWRRLYEIGKRIEKEEYAHGHHGDSESNAENPAIHRGRNQPR
jgi:hypothetical protein